MEQPGLLVVAPAVAAGAAAWFAVVIAAGHSDWRRREPRTFWTTMGALGTGTLLMAAILLFLVVLSDG